MYDQRRCEAFCGAKPDQPPPDRAPMPLTIRRFFGLRREYARDRRGAGPCQLPDTHALCRFSAIAKPYRLRECPAAFAGRPLSHPKDRPMHSLLRPLGRTSLFPLASGALALLAVLGLGMAFGLRADAQNADQIVARVNGTDLKASDVAIAEEDIGASLQQIPPES